MKGSPDIKSLLVFILILNSFNSFSQKKESITVITNPRSAVIRLDTSLLKSNVPISVLPGEYTLKMWAPNRRFYEQKLNVSSDSNIRIMKTLTFSKEYINYQKDLKKYKIKRTASRVVPIVFFTGITLFNFKRVGRLSQELDERYDRVISAQELYNSSIHFEDIDSKRDVFNSNKEAYNNEHKTLNQAEVITYGTIGVGAVISWFFIKYSNKLEKPTYQQKTLLSNLNINYGDNNGVNSFILTYNF
jgi:hypothetical protein